MLKWHREGENRAVRLWGPPALGVMLECEERFPGMIISVTWSQGNLQRKKKSSMWHASLLAFQTFLVFLTFF